MAKKRIVKNEEKDLEPEVRKLLDDESSYFDEDAEVEDWLYDDEEFEEIDYDNLNFTPIAELKEGDSEISIKGVIDAVGEKNSSVDHVCIQTIIKDDSGEIKVTFWNEDVEKVKEGLEVVIPKGYVTSFNKQLQLNSNRRYEVLFK